MTAAGGHTSSMSLVARATLGSAVAGAVVFGVALGAQTALALGVAYPFKAFALFLVTMGVALSRLGRHHPFDRLGLANGITAFRALLMSLVAGAVGESGGDELALAAGLTALGATILDGADGRAARRSGMASPFGARFDMEVDALLMLALAVLVYQFQKAGGWVLASGLLRYAFVAAGWRLPWMRRALPPSRRRQVVCVIQLAGLMLAIAPFVPVPLSVWIAAASLTVLTWSFGVDIIWLWRRRKEIL
jgi:phosphatidylglycerophosphate synthase